MSTIPTQAEQRAALAALLTGITATVGGAEVTTTGYPVQPATISGYDAWPVWTATRPVTWCADETDWQVLLAVPGPDPQTWAATGDPLVTAVAEALAPYQLTRIEPVQILLTEGGSMPGLQFTVTI